jgi:hypothetical protein
MFRRLLYVNFRIVYKVSKTGRDRLTPAGMLVFGTLIFAGIFGFDTRQSLSFQIFSIAASLLLLSLLTTPYFRGRIGLRRKLPEYGTVGHLLHYKLQIENLGNKPQQDLVLLEELQASLPTCDEFFSASDPQDRNRNWFDRTVGYPRLMSLLHKKRGAAIEPVTVDNLAANDHTEIKLEFLPVRRGYIHFAAARLARPDPLGLMRAIRSMQLQDSVLILPELFRVPVPELPGNRKYQQGGINAASTVGDSQEFMSLRDYRPGDPLRSIHWRSYAKKGHPVVKEFQDEFIVRQGLLLDTFLENKSTARFEAAVSLAASFSFSFSRDTRDSLLDLMFIGAEAYRFTSGRGLGNSGSMLEILACIEPCPHPEFHQLRDLILRHTSDTSGMICIFLNWDEKRQALISKLINIRIPVLVFLIREEAEHPEPGPMQQCPERFHCLHPENIQQQLDRIFDGL